MTAASAPSGSARITASSPSASSAAQRQTSFPSLAQYSGSRPSMPQAARTASCTGMACSSSSMPKGCPSANSFSVVARPPRVGSRRMRMLPQCESIASVRRFSAAQSDRISPCIMPLRASITAVPWSPTAPETRTASPGFTAVRPGRRCFILPMPDVLIYSLSPRPRSTTLVSPVTI